MSGPFTGGGKIGRAGTIEVHRGELFDGSGTEADDWIDLLDRRLSGWLRANETHPWGTSSIDSRGSCEVGWVCSDAATRGL